MGDYIVVANCQPSSPFNLSWVSNNKMDSESQQLSQESAQSADAQENSGSSRHFDLLDGHCIVCRRAFPLESEANEVFEAICICRECKSLVLDDLETNITLRDSRRSQLQRGRSRRGSSESIEDLFSQQFSQLISLVRQNHEALLENFTHQHATYNTNRSRSRRSRRTVSDNDSDGFDRIDSLFGESDSNISFSGYGGESDASADRHSLLDREMFIQLDNESLNLSDTDIDPMNAGLHQWNSNDLDEEDEEWEDDFEEEVAEQDGGHQDTSNSPFGSSGRGVQNGMLIHWRLRADNLTQYPDIFSDLEDSEIPPYVGNSGDYLDARGFEELLEQLAETDGSRRGAPPAAASFVGNLPRVVISKDHENNGSLICAVCKDPLPVDTEANQLPCLHLYHPSCILPWLTARNSCPLCRYELPTDNPDYEEGKRNVGRSQFNEARRDDLVEESSSNGSSDLEGYVASELMIPGRAHEDSVNIEGNRRGWLFFAAAAAPIVSIVGVVLVMWFRNPEGRGPQRLRRSARTNLSSSESQRGKSRRWWSFFGQ